MEAQPKPAIWNVEGIMGAESLSEKEASRPARLLTGRNTW